MIGRRFLALLLVSASLAAPAQAGLFGKKKPKPDPAVRVPELIGIAKSSPDEDKRSEAVEELRDYDAQAHPDIIPVLIDVLANDAKPGVRVNAAQSLGKIRPVSLTVGQALEQSVAKDSSMRVRLQARSSLFQYQWAGYRSLKKEATTTKEPPLAPPLPSPGSAPAPTPQGAPPVIQTTPAPTAAAPRLMPVPAGAPAKPLPSGPARPATTSGPELGPAPY